MTELGLIVGINCAGLIFAGLLTRWIRGRDPGTNALRRVEGAVRRAMEGVLWRQFQLVAVALAGLCVLAFAAHGLAGPSGPVGPFEAGFWSAVGLTVGALTGCLVAVVAARLALSASLRTATATHVSTDRSLTIAVRAGGATGLVAEAVSVLGVLALLLIPFAIKGGFSLPAEAAAELAARVAALLPAFGLGAATAALIIQRGGSVYYCAGRMGPEFAGDCRAALDDSDARNPAIVAELVGGHLGVTASRALDLWLTATLANVAAVVVGAAFYLTNLATLPDALALACLPFVVRAFGVIASGFGVMVVHTEETRPPAEAIWRGQATTITLAIGGVFGACVWLAGDHHWGWLVAAGVTALLAVAAAGHAARHALHRRFGPLREVKEVRTTGGILHLAQAFGLGLGSAVIPILTLAIALAAAWQFGVATGLQGGGPFAAITALMVMLASSPYLLAVTTFGPITDDARGMAAVGAVQASPDSERRTARLSEAGRIARTVGQTTLALVSAAAGVLAATVLPLLGFTRQPTELAQMVDLHHPAVLGCGALGAAVLLAYTGSTIRAAARGARGVAAEVERQLGGFPRQRSAIQIPADYTPSYRACIDVAARASLRQLLPTAAVFLLPPAVLGGIVALTYRALDPAVAPQALASFVGFSAIAGLAATLALEGTRGVLAAARRGDRPRSGQTGSTATSAAEALAGVMGDAAGPAAHLLLKATALSALAIATFLF